MSDPVAPQLAGKRLVLGVKEAGAGSLLAKLVDQWQPAPGSLVYVSETAAPYFSKTSLVQKVIGSADPGISPGLLVEKIREIKPHALVCGASAGPSIEKQLIVAGQHLGLPVYSFVDHYWNLWQRFADENTAEPWRYVPDYICVPAPQCAAKIIASGAPAARVQVFSHPLMRVAAPVMRGAAPEQQLLDKAQACAALNLDAHSTIILFVSEYGFPLSEKWQWEQAPQSDVEGLLKGLFEVARRVKTKGPVTIVIKMHPAETRDWSAVCAGFPDIAHKIIKMADKAALFSASDIAFGLNSMLLLEAAMAGLPAYSCHLSKSDAALWLSSIHGGISELDTLEDCFRVVYECLP